jgi:hypothetical protein
VPLLPTFLPFLFVKEGGRCVRSGFFELARGGVGEGRVSWQMALGSESHNGVHPGSKGENFLLPEVDEGPL